MNCFFVAKISRFRFANLANRLAIPGGLRLESRNFVSRFIQIEGLVKSQKKAISVIPAKAGVQR